jgi:hypothetical protein
MQAEYVSNIPIVLEPAPAPVELGLEEPQAANARAQHTPTSAIDTRALPDPVPAVSSIVSTSRSVALIVSPGRL